MLENIELILNDNLTGKAIDKGKVFADVIYKGSSKTFKVVPIVFDKKERLFKEIENSTPCNLLSNSVNKNKGKNLKAITPSEENVIVDENNNIINENPTNDSNADGGDLSNAGTTRKLTVLSPEKFGDITKWSDLTPEDLDSRADEINNAWEQLEQDRLIAVTEEDFIILQAREELLLSAERELEAARAFIEEQEGKLSAQRSFIYMMIVLILLLGGFAFYLIRSIKVKNKLNKELDDKNKRITSSINYAERIQKSVLLRDEEIKAIFPKSFVFYQPLDVVSGDFYWFSEVNGKAIMAAIDCTGHGVPGAFMSLIGNTLMNQIINEKKITSPAEILKHLHEGIVGSLNQTDDMKSAQDGMDMSICCLDKSNGELTFAGAVNPIYIVEKGEIREIAADIRGIGGVFGKRKREVTFTEQKLNLSKGSMIYMFSDGYMDQFGGPNDQKFNIPRFKELLLEANKVSIEEQKQKFKEKLEAWKGQSKQIDDILIIGVEV